MAKENKIITCKHCGKEIAESAKTCPNCGGKNKKPIYKKQWFWAIVAVIVISAFAGGSDKDTEKNTEVKQEITTKGDTTAETNTNDKNNEEESTNEAEKVSAEYKNALRKAETYADIMHMSKAAIYDQLTSEYGEQFPEDAAQYAIDNMEADWKANALAKAKTYQEQMSMSKAAIYDQLTSEYGEKFTAEEAQYAVDHLDD